jgi:hypothetical protein
LIADSNPQAQDALIASNSSNNAFARIDLDGKIKLTNYRDKTVEVEVTRHVLGNVTGADNGGVITRVNVFEDGSYMAAGDDPQ